MKLKLATITLLASSLSGCIVVPSQPAYVVRPSPVVIAAPAAVYVGAPATAVVVRRPPVRRVVIY
jgi:hypothetical protein